MSVRKAQTDFFSPMTGNVFRDNRRRADLIMEAAKVDLIKTDDPFTQIRERKSYYSPDDSRAITDAFDRDYGVLSDQEAAQILEENRQLIEEPTPVINPEPTPTPEPTPEPTPTPEPESTPEKAVEKAKGFSKSGRKAFMGNSKYKSPRRVANRNKAKAMAKARKAKKSGPSTSSSTGSRGGRSQGRGGARGGSTGGRGASSKGGTGSGRSSQGRGGARGGSTGGRGASSKGGVSRGSRRGGVGRGGRRGGRRCDIRCKFDISLLSNMNLIRDDLAELAYFVKEISS